MSESLIRVMVVDDHELLRDSVCHILDCHQDIAVIATAVDAQTAVDRAVEHVPDVVVMDVSLVESTGMEATRAVLAAVPTTSIIAFSGFADETYVRAMIDAGARGYVLKTCLDELPEAVRRVAAGVRFLGTGVEVPREVRHEN